MPLFYLRPVNDETQFNNAADYPEGIPWPAPSGFEWIEGEPPAEASVIVEKDMNQLLEEAFLQMLPAHLGQPYLTTELSERIGSLKQVVTDYNRLGLFALSKAMIQDVTLPTEMEADRQALLTLYPEA